MDNGRIKDKNKPVLSCANFPITYFYEQFNIRNNLRYFQHTTQSERIRKGHKEKLLYDFKAKLYERKYIESPFEHLNGAWIAFLKAKEIIIKENKSLFEVYLDAEKYGISRDDLDNVGYLSVSNMLNNLVNIKEHLFGFINWEELASDKEYQALKERMFSGDKSGLFIHMNDSNLLSTLRNALAHNNYSLSSVNGKVAINIFPKGQKNRMGSAITLNMFEKYMQKLTSHVDASLVRLYNQNKQSGGGIFLNNEVYFTRGELAPAKPDEQKRKRLFTTYYSAGKMPNYLISHEAKTLEMISCDMCDSFSRLIIENPNLKGDTLRWKLDQMLRKYKVNNKVMSTFDPFKNDDGLLVQDALRYAQFVFTSDCYDRYTDYNQNKRLRKYLKGDINALLDGLRNSVTHQWYYFKDSNRIKFSDLTQSGCIKLKYSKMKTSHLIKGKTDSEDLCVAFAKNQIERCDLHKVVNLSPAELIEVCNIVANYHTEKTSEDGDENGLV